MTSQAVSSPIEQIRRQVEPLRKAIAGHNLYKTITSPAEVQQFMRMHVYAVWDFMSLLKSLQNTLTCTQVPWMPAGDAETRFLINEIVCGEESDIDPTGKRMSHFEMYLAAMQQSGASTEEIQQVLHTIRQGVKPAEAMEEAGAAAEAIAFVKHTFEVIAGGKPHVMASVFTFGREDLIPEMFYGLVRDLGERFPDKYGLFQYYLQRHIEIDGDHHSQLALQMVAHLCGDDPEKWQEAGEAAVKSLEQRLELWNGIARRL